MTSLLSTSITSFGQTAVRLAHNPLGIVALFIVLVYALAALVAGFGNFAPGDRRIFVWFLVLFPVAVLGSFLWLVARHSTKLYAPRDFADAETYLRVLAMSSGAQAVEVSAESLHNARTALQPILRSEATDSQLLISIHHQMEQ